MLVLKTSPHLVQSLHLQVLKERRQQLDGMVCQYYWEHPKSLMPTQSKKETQTLTTHNKLQFQKPQILPFWGPTPTSESMDLSPGGKKKLQKHIKFAYNFRSSQPPWSPSTHCLRIHRLQLKNFRTGRNSSKSMKFWNLDYQFKAIGSCEDTNI